MAGFSTLQDTFDDGTIDPVKWSQSYGDPIEADGHAKVPCTTGYAGLRSASSYTLTGSAVFLRVYPPAAGGATSAAASIFIQSATGGTDAGFLIDTAGNAVGLYLREGYADGGAVFLTYSPTDHAWIRIREDAGSVYWDTSPDGVTWTNRRTATTPAWAADTDLSVVIEGHRDAGTDDYVEADNFNVAAVTTYDGSASLSADSGLTVAGQRTAVANAAMTAQAALAAAVTPVRPANTALVASSTLTVTAVRRALAAATLTATATLTARTVGANLDSLTAGIPRTRWAAGTPRT